MLARLLAAGDIEVLPLTGAHDDVAIRAWMRFGRGRHPAALSFGDCLTYATAAVAGRPLVCVGEGFAQTDLVLAEWGG